MSAPREQAPAYGPQGRWTELRRERDEAVAEVERLRETLRAVSGHLTDLGITDGVAVDRSLAVARRALEASSEPRP